MSGPYDRVVTVAEWRITAAEWPEAVGKTDGYQIVVAGPGTGKTEFLVRRVARILGASLARREDLVVLAFSRRSAAALRRRIEVAAGRSGVPIDVTTFHSLALRIGETLSEGQSPTPLTTPEQVAVVGSVLADEDRGEWPLIYREILDTPPFATEVADFLMRCSERLLSPDDLAVLARERADWRGLPGLYRRYLDRLEILGRTDYGVLLATTALHLKANPDLADRYRYVLVDEYQDTTPAQAEIARLLAATHNNLTVAGDPYQSIYSFRGAELRNVADFTDTHPDAQRIVLTESFRVPEEILTAALRVVSGGDLPGAAGPVTPTGHPGRSEAYQFDQETAEAEWIAAEVERSIVVGGVEPSRIAVLVRSKRELLSELSRALDRRKVPHDPPDNRLVDHPAVVLLRDLVTVARTGGSLPTTSAVEAAGADRAMRRILLGPLVGLSLGRERELLRTRRRTRSPWSQVLSEGLPDRPGLAAVISNPTWASKGAAADGFWHLWNTIDGIEPLIEDPERSDWRGALTAFSQTLSRQAERDSKVSLAEYFSLIDEEDFEATPMLTAHHPTDQVTLTTLHQAKGLEFEVVFIASASEGVFPDLRRARRMLRPELLSAERLTDPTAQHLFALQEEMRLAYTAMTRASSRVVWTTTAAGVDQAERRPSRFLLAAFGRHLSDLGPPVEEIREPITLNEAGTMLRRWLLDPGEASVRRLGAARLLAGHAGPDSWDPNRFAGMPAAGPDKPILPEFIRLSPSQGDSYETCPRRYALERRLGLSELASAHAGFGSLCHTVLERAESEVIGTDAPHADIARVKELINETWEGADFGTPELNAAWRSKAVEMFEKLYERWPGRGRVETVEESVELEVEGVRWVGLIDRIERTPNGLKVVDLKTGTGVPSVPEAGESLQLGFYVAARTSEHDPVLAASFWYPRKKDSVSVTTRSFDMAKLDSVRERMRSITQSILEERWEPRIGSHCKWCSFRNTCPLWPEGRGGFLP